MSDPGRVVGLAVGIVVVVATMGSVFTTLVVPRMSSARMLRVVSHGLGRAVLPALRLLRRYPAQDRVLALVGPLGIVTVFVAWLAVLMMGFALIMWWTGGTTFGHAVAVSASSIFTLGVLNLSDRGSQAVEFVTAGTGFLVIALEIAYLPTLYNAFAGREAEVTLLATRAGVPAWGPEVLARHHRFGTMGELPALYGQWERWAAAVAESHANYPTLMWLRSPEPLRSWLTGLMAILDAAALQDALTPGASPRQARLCLAMGTNCLRSLAMALRMPFDSDPLPTAPVRLRYEEFLEGIDRLERAGFPFERTPQEAWRHFRGWRVNYERIVDDLTAVIVPPPAPWFLERPWLGSATPPRILNRTPDDPAASTPRT